MKMAIQSGDPKAVDDLMERLSDTLAVDILTTTYGGGFFYWEEDEDDLFSGTYPILHAARSGNLAVFDSVMKAMEAKLSREQVTSHTIKLSFGYLESRRLYQRSKYMAHNFAQFSVLIYHLYVLGVRPFENRETQTRSK